MDQKWTKIPFESVHEKIKENGFTQEKNNSLYWQQWFPLNRKSIDNKGLFKIYFHEMEKLLPIERIFEELEQNGSH